MSRDPLTAEALHTLVEKTVREMLARAAAQSNPDQTQPLKTGPSQGRTAPNENTFHGSVLHAELARTFTAGQPLRVAANTVVTPAASDWLRDKGIRLARGGEAGLSAARPVSGHIADADGHRRCGFVARQLALRGLPVRGVGMGDLINGSESQGIAGVILSDMPPAVVWRAAKKLDHPIAQITERDEISDLVLSLNPRVWVIDMRRNRLSSAVALAQACLQASLAAKSTVVADPANRGTGK